MHSKRSEVGDEGNTSFGLPGSGPKDLKPRIDYREGKRQHATEGDDHRFPRRDRKDIPAVSLAERIRKALKGG
jgi:hypothetical protein